MHITHKFHWNTKVNLEQSKAMQSGANILSQKTLAINHLIEIASSRLDGMMEKSKLWTATPWRWVYVCKKIPMLKWWRCTARLVYFFLVFYVFLVFAAQRRARKLEISRFWVRRYEYINFLYVAVAPFSLLLCTLCTVRIQFFVLYTRQTFSISIFKLF